MIPIVIPQIAVGVVFRLVFAPDYGILNVMLGLTGPSQPLWLSVPQLALIATAAVDIWQWTPFVYLVMFAGLQTVPSESVEAAQVDGATNLTLFRYIELPYLRPLILLVLFFRIADVIRVFDQVYVLTGGGPGTTTQYLSLYIYRIGFKFSDLGQASALAVVVMVSMTLFYTVVVALPAGGPAMRSRRWTPTRVATAILLAVIGLVFAFPLFYLVVTSLKTKADLFAPVPSLFPPDPTLQAYYSVLVTRGFSELLVNSIVVGLGATTLAICIAFAICYPITRLPAPRRLRAFVLSWSLSLRFLPPVAVVIPYFAIVRAIGLYNQLPALILVYTIFNLPLAIWMLRGFLDEIPLEIEEAALVDGASRWYAFRHIVLPLARTAILAVGIIVFAFDWAEFLFAFILTATPQAMTFPVGVQGLVTQFEIIWNDMAAGGVIAIVIPLSLMLIARRHVMTGLTFGVIREK